MLLLNSLEQGVIQGKGIPFLFQSALTMHQLIFYLVQNDVWISPTSSRVGYIYFVIVVDDYSCHTWVYLLRSKSKSYVFLIFQQFVSMGSCSLSLTAQTYWLEMCLYYKTEIRSKYSQIQN